MKLEEYGIAKTWYACSSSGQCSKPFNCFADAVKHIILMEQRRRNHKRIMRRTICLTYHGNDISIPCHVHYLYNKIVLRCPSSYYNGIAVNFNVNKAKFPDSISGYKLSIEK